MFIRRLLSALYKIFIHSFIDCRPYIVTFVFNLFSISACGNITGQCGTAIGNFSVLILAGLSDKPMPMNGAFYTYSLCVFFQGGLETSQSMVLPLQSFCDHVTDTGWTLWTYVQDELFLPMRQLLRRDVGTSVRLSGFYCASALRT